MWRLVILFLSIGAAAAFIVPEQSQVFPAFLPSTFQAGDVSILNNETFNGLLSYATAPIQVLELSTDVLWTVGYTDPLTGYQWNANFDGITNKDFSDTLMWLYAVNQGALFDPDELLLLGVEVNWLAYNVFALRVQAIDVWALHCNQSAEEDTALLTYMQGWYTASTTIWPACPTAAPTLTYSYFQLGGTGSVSIYPAGQRATIAINGLPPTPPYEYTLGLAVTASPTGAIATRSITVGVDANSNTFVRGATDAGAWPPASLALTVNTSTGAIVTSPLVITSPIGYSSLQFGYTVSGPVQGVSLGTSALAVWVMDPVGPCFTLFGRPTAGPVVPVDPVAVQAWFNAVAAGTTLTCRIFADLSPVAVHWWDVYIGPRRYGLQTTFVVQFVSSGPVLPLGILVRPLLDPALFTINPGILSGYVPFRAGFGAGTVQLYNSTCGIPITPFEDSTFNGNPDGFTPELIAAPLCGTATCSPPGCQLYSVLTSFNISVACASTACYNTTDIPWDQEGPCYGSGCSVFWSIFFQANVSAILNSTTLCTRYASNQPIGVVVAVNAWTDPTGLPQLFSWPVLYTSTDPRSVYTPGCTGLGPSVYTLGTIAAQLRPSLILGPPVTVFTLNATIVAISAMFLGFFGCVMICMTVWLSLGTSWMFAWNPAVLPFFTLRRRKGPPPPPVVKRATIQPPRRIDGRPEIRLKKTS